MLSRITRIFMALSLAVVLTVPQLAAASANVVEEKPTALAMTGDLILVRPVMLGLTIVGTAVFLVSLPFSLLGGNAGEAGKTLVVGPAETTFVRCLGCTKPGYKKTVRTEEDEE